MQKNGYREATIRGTIQALKTVVNRCNLLEPEFVKGYLAKEKACEDLDRFYKYKKIPWVKPHYDRVATLPFSPVHSQVILAHRVIAGKMRECVGGN